MARTYPDATARRLGDLVTVYLRPHVGIATDDMTGTPIVDFDPPLTAEEQTTLATIVALARSGMAHLSPAEYATIRPHLQTLRDLRQMGRNAFMALTAAERDRLMYDAHTATTTILLALLRD